ncbi:hypothetical protein CEXT_295851, partial [Caerostris extrusa]
KVNEEPAGRSLMAIHLIPLRSPPGARSKLLCVCVLGAGLAPPLSSLRFPPRYSLAQLSALRAVRLSDS